MGSKYLKAIVVVGGRAEVPVADRKTIDSISPELARTVREEKLDLAEFGTSQLTQIMNDLGCYPVRNFHTSHLENIEAISANTMKNKQCGQELHLLQVRHCVRASVQGETGPVRRYNGQTRIRVHLGPWWTLRRNRLLRHPWGTSFVQ